MQVVGQQDDSTGHHDHATVTLTALATGHALCSPDSTPLKTLVAPTSNPTGSSVQGRCFGKNNNATRPVSDVDYGCSGKSDECV